MPVETRSPRDTSAVGRFPSVTLASADEDEEPPEERDDACRRWLRGACLCCRLESESDDLKDTLVTAVEDAGAGQRPATEDSELHELPLRVVSVDLLRSKAAQNRVEHRTDLYQGDHCIVRRGQKFHMWLTLSRPFHAQTDKLHLELKTVPQTGSLRREW